MFTIRVFVADFFLTCQAEEASLLDLATLQRLSAEHVGPRLELRIGDTGWVAEVRGEDGQLGYLIVEFQSRVDRTVPVRAMRYVNSIYHSSLAESGGDSARRRAAGGAVHGPCAVDGAAAAGGGAQQRVCDGVSASGAVQAG